MDQFGLLLGHLRQSEQLSFLEAIFRDVQKRFFSTDFIGEFEDLASHDSTVSRVAALCSVIIGDRPFLTSQISEWLSKSQGGSIQTIGLRRALLASFHDSNGKL